MISLIDSPSATPLTTQSSFEGPIKTTSASSGATTNIYNSILPAQETTPHEPALIQIFTAITSMIQTLVALLQEMMKSNSGYSDIPVPIEEPPTTVPVGSTPQPPTSTSPPTTTTTPTSTNTGSTSGTGSTGGATDSSTGASTKPRDIGTTLPSSKGQFIWKPVSESDGKLAIVLPANLTKKVKSVKVLSPDKKKTLATGKSAGIANGDREHYRFTKPGSSYPPGSVVVITLADGKVYNVPIKDTAKRYTR